jgi:concanavalin A-like lectin/glucanase superfamily protein/Big-like domain-containing protein/calcineurin-like phosphoesterase family protein
LRAALVMFPVLLAHAIFLVFSLSSLITQNASGLSDFNIGAVGDWGCNSNTEDTVDNIDSKSPELVLALGDYSYRSTATCWLDDIEPIDSITKINIGNHEDDNSEDYNTYINHFHLGNPYYSYNLNNVHILTMDSDRTSYASGSAQYNFVINDLQSASQNPNIDWIIVNIHQWIYRSSSSNPVNDDVAEIYHPFFDQYGVDLVLAGHDHKYHRTFPIKFNPGNPLKPIVTSTNTNDYTDPQGTIFAVVGTGGINLSPIDGSSPFIASAQDDYFGQLDIKITNTGAKLEARFYPNGGGSTKDSFSITKTGGGGSGSYNYAPNFAATGSSYFDVASSPSLKLSQFSAAAWFKTSSNFGDDTVIVNKGGFGSESSGQNMNWGIWMDSAERIKGGFETSSGTDFFATSPTSYNDNQWHYAVVTYGGSTVILYIDGVQVGSKSTSGASPDSSGTKPVRVAANSRVTPPTTNFFIGDIDEVRAWNDDLTATEQANAFAGTSFNTGEQVLYLPFGANSPPIAQSQSVSTVKNTPVGITLIATDPNNDPLTYSIVTQPAHGTITAGTTASRTYTPATDYTGPDSFTFKANDGTVDSNIATVSIAVNNPGSGGYNYAPGFTATGSNYFDVASSSSLQLSSFSVASWFKTSTNFGAEGFIVNKGGIGSDSAGQNMNYQLSMSSTEQIKVGFETSSGADFFVTSPITYNDNQWHYAVVTYDGSANLILYIDGVQVASKSTGGASPETTGTKPVRVGANSRVTPPSNFFTGEIDEVRVWKDDLTPTEVTNAFTGTNFNTADQVLYLDFTNVQSGLSGGYTYGPSLTLSGP